MDPSARALELLYAGKLPSEIADELGVSEQEAIDLVFTAMSRAGERREFVVVDRDPDPGALENGESYLYVQFSDGVSDQHELIHDVARHLGSLPGVERAWREDTELILVKGSMGEANVLAAVKQWWASHGGPA